MNTRASLAALLVLATVLLTPSSLLAQARSSETLYIRPRVGLSSYLGDNEKSPFSFLSEQADAYNVDGKFPYVFGLELGYMFNPRYSLGLGVVFADFPVITQHLSNNNNFTKDHSTTRTSIQLAARYLFTQGRVAPYFQGGFHATFGKVAALPDTDPARATCLTTTVCPESNETSFGPMLGLGLDFAISPQFSLDLGISTNWAFGDTKADGRDDRGFTGGDFLTHMTAGFMYRFKGLCTPADVTSLDGPSTLTVGQQGTFMGNMNDDASTPVTYTMDFGDGARASELTASHTYSRAGSYTVQLSATNCAGTTMASLPVTVAEACNAAQIVTMTASNLNPDTQTSVNFTANVNGSAPITYRWNFGDGSTSTQANPSHTYSQPGTYTVTLEATNCGGTTQRTLTVTVRPYEPPYCATLSEMNTVYFGRNSSTLTEEGRAQLQENLQIMRDCTQINVRIEGWAAPGERNAQQLSEDRARAVEQFYIDNGVAASRVVATGRGRATGVSKEGASQYQRADSIPLRN